MIRNINRRFYYEKNKSIYARGSTDYPFNPWYCCGGNSAECCAKFLETNYDYETSKGVYKFGKNCC